MCEKMQERVSTGERTRLRYSDQTDIGGSRACQRMGERQEGPQRAEPHMPTPCAQGQGCGDEMDGRARERESVEEMLMMIVEMLSVIVVFV